MSNPNKAKGTRFESAIRDLANSKGHTAVRPAQMGAGDVGDVHIDGLLCVQAKDVARWSVSGWLDDAQEQAERADLPFAAVVMKKRMASTGQAYAVMTLEDLLALLRRLRIAEKFIGSDVYMDHHYRDVLKEQA